MMQSVLRQSFSGAIVFACCLGLNAQESHSLSRRLSENLTIRLTPPPSAYFVLEGLSTNTPLPAHDAFRVTVHTNELTDPPAVLGTYRATPEGLRFDPRFPLSQSVQYAVHLSPAIQKQLQNTDPLIFQLPTPTAEPTAKVAAVYPSADELPDNLLKFYIHFSEPMSRGEAYQRIHLFQGEQLVEQSFLELGEELWDSNQTRFTLFIHPGRIKRGLKPHEDDGPAITAGKLYTLKIDSAWQAANGQPMAEKFEKKFIVTPADHEQPTPEQWKIEMPKQQTLEPVALLFNEPLDHAMLERVLIVRHQSGQTIGGSITVAEGETKWLFAPNQPWAVGTYYIDVAANLEDRCGNSIARPFEVKMQDRTAANPRTQIAVEFIVK